jgi:hypothetical protein
MVLGLLFALAASNVPVAAEDDARQLVRRTLEALPKAAFVARIKLTGDTRGEREALVKHKVVDDARATYLEVTAPEFLVGMRFLFKERLGQPPVQYMRYIATTIPVLIGGETRAERFLGSTFYLADVAEPDLNAFTYEFVGEEVINGRKCKLVQSTPTDPKKEVYGKIIHAIDPTDLLVLHRKFFDHKGQAIKEWSAKKVEKVDGYWTVLDQQMKDLTQDMESRIEMTEIQYGAEIPDSVFTTEYLVR